MCLKKKKEYLKEHFFSSCEKYFRGTFWRRLLICPVKCAKFPCLVILLKAQRLRVCWGRIFFPFFFFLIRSDTLHCDCLTEGSGINIFFLYSSLQLATFTKLKRFYVWETMLSLMSCTTSFLVLTLFTCEYLHSYAKPVFFQLPFWLI